VLSHHNAEYFSEEELSRFRWGSRGRDVRIHRTCVLVETGNMFIADHVRVDPYVILSASNRLNIGSYVHIAAAVTILGREAVDIRDYAGISQGVRILSATDDFSGAAMTGPLIPPHFTKVHAAPVMIKEHVVVGAGSVILPGVTIDTGTTVGAMSLVNRSLDAWGMYFGVPARRFRDRERGVLDLQRQFEATRDSD